MRVLTIKQPWAGAIFALQKNVENRSWYTPYRGLLLIHAGAALDKSAPIEPAEGDVWTAGSIIGAVELVGCVQMQAGKWAAAGAWHWLLKNPVTLSKPMAARGRLGLWSLDDGAMRVLKRRLLV